MLDESSLASTKQIHEFVNRLHPNDRVLLVGDRRQHEAIEAGRPFAQLQDAGMKTVNFRTPDIAYFLRVNPALFVVQGSDQYLSGIFVR